ncbi:alpha/beta fold hydrolase [Dactylosporangium sp. NPDC049140]|jgi:pimeloyl-ACP methyl ester carboxylesterase|uniref:alpha/beta fold hydrolase n=1 Tax=Dactylosporangium sp. NPDC049140 TaxID=3155647 RepID=UPI0034017C2D
MVERFANDGLEFEVDDLGDPGAPAVVLLHGFPQDRRAWAGVAELLVAAGRRVLVPELRGYAEHGSPGSRRRYTLDVLTTDVLALARTAGVDRFDLAGHDWGAALAFHVAGRHPERVRTLTALSVPHRGAWAGAGARQLWRSAYIGLFQLPVLPELALTPRFLERRLVRSGLGAEHARRYATAKNRRALHWYRAMLVPGRKQFPRVTVPTLFAWGDGDEFVTERLARRCGRWVDGEYTFEILRGVRHWIPEMHPRRAAELVLSRCR